MNKINSLISISFAFVFLTALSGSSDYEKLKPIIVEKDPVAFALELPNMLVCFLSKTNPHKNVGKGPYLSRVNMDLCLNGSEGPIDFWTDIYSKVTKNPNNSSGYIADIWFTTSLDDSPAFIRFTINSPPFKENLNGNLTFFGCIESSTLGSDCLIKTFGKIENNLLEVYFLKKENAGGTLGEFSIIQANVTEQSGFGAFQKIGKFDLGQGMIAMKHIGQYSFSNKKALVNFDVSDNPVELGGFEFAESATCNSTKLSEYSKEVKNYNLYDQNGAYVATIGGDTQPTLPAVKFEYQNLDYLWEDLLTESNSSNFFNTIDKAQITSNGNTYYIRPSDYNSVPKILPSNDCSDLTLTQTTQYKNDIQTIFDSVTTNNNISFNSFGTKDSSWEDPRSTIGARPILSNSTYKYVHGNTP